MSFDSGDIEALTRALFWMFLTVLAIVGLAWLIQTARRHYLGDGEPADSPLDLLTAINDARDEGELESEEHARIRARLIERANLAKAAGAAPARRSSKDDGEPA